MGEDGGLIPCFCQKYLGRAHVTRLTEGSRKKGAGHHFPQTSLFPPQWKRQIFPHPDIIISEKNCLQRGEMLVKTGWGKCH